MKSLTNEQQSPLSSAIGRLEFRIAVKAGIAAILSYICGVGLSYILEHPSSSISVTWTVLATFVVLQAHLGGTYRAAWIRFQGTLVGVVCGGILTSLLGFHPITLGISVFLTVLICCWLDIKDSIRIACMSACIVMLLWGLRPTMSPWTFSLFRLLDSTVGILVAVFVAHTIWPAQATQHLRQHLGRTILTLRRIYRLSLGISPAPKHYHQSVRRMTRDINLMLQENREFVADSELEIMSRSRRIEAWNYLIDHIQQLFEAIMVLERFRESKVTKIVDKNLRNQLENTIEYTDKAFAGLLTLFKRQETEALLDLEACIDELDDELSRFRMTRTTREFEREEVEEFFVYFYNLRTVVEEILRIGKKIQKINEDISA